MPKRPSLSVATVLLPVLLTASAFCSPGTKPSHDAKRRAAAPSYAPTQLLVRFRPGVEPSAKRAHHAALGATVEKEFRVVDNLQLVRIPANMPVKYAARFYRQQADVLYAEPNFLRHTMDAPVTPNDPLYSTMWSLHNTGQDGGTPGADIRAPEAWAITTGSSSVVVATIDSGVDYGHSDLAANLWSNPSSTTITVGGTTVTCAPGTHGLNAIAMTCNPLDDNGHGTHVAGTIGAAGNNGTGVVGLSWQVELMSCKFLDFSGSGTTADLLTCLEYIALMKDRGVNVIATNNSYGGGGWSQAEFDAIDAHRQRGILFVAAAGNSWGRNNDLLAAYPANYELPHILAVAATDRFDAIADFSNVGPHTVHIAAPGKEILSTFPGNDYYSFSGTSMAAPHVVGVAALLKAQDPSRDWKTIKNLILAGGDTIPGAEKTISRKRLNAYGALNCSNSVVQRLLRPMSDHAYVSAGGTLVFRLLSIECGAPTGTVTVSVDGGTQTITMADDGLGPDVEANDGVYVAQRQWLASEEGAHTLTFPNHEVLTVHVVSPLAPYSLSPGVPFAYRTIPDNDLGLMDDDSAVISPPFPVNFGGGSFSTLHVNSNGNITFFEPFVEWDNTPLPAAGVPAIVAPFWDDIYGQVQWGVLGSAPNRELVIEWFNSYSMGCVWSYSPEPAGRFQVVFFEGSSDILFNYADVSLGASTPGDPLMGCAWDSDAGASATVGVQSAGDLANQMSFNAPTLSANSSALWQIGPLTPSITALAPFAVPSGSAGFTLHVMGRSLLPGAVVRWNGSDRLTNFINAGELTIDVPFADLAGAATVSITVLNPASNGGPESQPAAFHIYATNPVPKLSGITPDPVPRPLASEPQYYATVRIRVDGSDFLPGSVLRWNGVNLTTTVLSSSAVEARLSSTMMTLGTAFVTVVNPAPGGGASGPLMVQVVNPAPVLLGLRVRVVGAGAPFTLPLIGKDFASSSVARLNGTDLATTVSGGYNLRATISAADVASVGTADITVFTPGPGGGTSETKTLSIVTPPANDHIENATVVSSVPVTILQDPTGATKSLTDKDFPCNPNPPQTVEETVWFSFLPPPGGMFVKANTAASNYSNFLSVWTGTPGNLVHVGCAASWYQPTVGFFTDSPTPVYFMVSTPYMGYMNDQLVFKLETGSGFEVALSPQTQTVARATEASYTVTVTPKYGSFDLPIELECDVWAHDNIANPQLPCTVSPHFAIPGSAVVTTTLTINTASAVARLEPGGLSPVYAFLLGAPVFGLLLAGSGRKHGTRAALCLLLLLFVLSIVLQACGGGGGVSPSGNPYNPPNPPNTKSRTYTVYILATGDNMYQANQASLTVTF